MADADSQNLYRKVIQVEQYEKVNRVHQSPDDRYILIRTPEGVEVPNATHNGDIPRFWNADSM